MMVITNIIDEILFNDITEQVVNNNFNSLIDVDFLFVDDVEGNILSVWFLIWSEGGASLHNILGRLH